MPGTTDIKDYGQTDFCVVMGDGALGQGDYAKALEYYRAGAAKALAAAQHNLAHMYQEGKGVAVNYEEAFKLYEKAAEQGAAPSQVNLGLMYYHGQGVAQDYQKAFE